jgi:hypothetical protein
MLFAIKLFAGKICRILISHSVKVESIQNLK